MKIHPTAIVSPKAVLADDVEIGPGVIIGDEVTLGKKAQEMALVAEAQSLPERDLPEYLALDGTKATFVRVPTLDEVPYPVKMEPNLVVEFYSR